MSKSMGNILNLPIPAVPVRLAAVAAFAVTLTDRRKGSPARADPYPGRENSAAGNFGLRARRGIFWYFPCKAVLNFRWCQSTDKDKGQVLWNIVSDHKLPGCRGLLKHYVIAH